MARDLNAPVSEEKMSRINSAGLINITLENLWKDCYNAMSRGALDLWNAKLDALWLILGGDVEQNGNEDKKMQVMDLEIYKLGQLKPGKSMGFKVATNENATKQYQLLKQKSLFLRRLQNKQGKGTAYQSDDDFDFD